MRGEFKKIKELLKELHDVVKEKIFFGYKVEKEAIDTLNNLYFKKKNGFYYVPCEICGNVYRRKKIKPFICKKCKKSYPQF